MIAYLIPDVALNIFIHCPAKHCQPWMSSHYLIQGLSLRSKMFFSLLQFDASLLQSTKCSLWTSFKAGCAMREFFLFNLGAQPKSNAEEGLQRICAVFVACCQQFTASYPSEFVSAEMDNLRSGFFSSNLLWTMNLLPHKLQVWVKQWILRFLMRHPDSELLVVLTNTEPPIDLQHVNLFRSICRKHDKKADMQFVQQWHSHWISCVFLIFRVGFWF